MDFASPWILSGLVLASLPVLIHLFSRRDYRPEPWAAMRFLKAAIERRQRQMRLESLLLLVLRTLVIVLLVLALAEPRFYAGSGVANSREPILRLLVLDLSASMGSRAGGTTAYDRAIAEVERLLDDAAAGDAFQLVRIAGSSPRAIIRRPTHMPADVRGELARWPLTEERGDVTATLQQVVELLRQTPEPARRQVVVLSDLQRTNWLPDEPRLRSRLQQLLRQTRAGGRAVHRCRAGSIRESGGDEDRTFA
ncbi:MAG: BatA domain-containing protein [Planctomycetaceae bacterium]